jgi:hypothetical protein
MQNNCTTSDRFRLQYSDLPVDLPFSCRLSLESTAVTGFSVERACFHELIFFSASNGWEDLLLDSCMLASWILFLLPLGCSLAWGLAAASSLVRRTNWAAVGLVGLVARVLMVTFVEY